MFRVDKEQKKAAREWTKEHLDICEVGTYIGAIGGRFSYIFTPTSLGVICTVRCVCGDQFDFSGDL